jgi:hypothetical protein
MPPLELGCTNLDNRMTSQCIVKRAMFQRFVSARSSDLGGREGRGMMVKMMAVVLRPIWVM